MCSDSAQIWAEHEIDGLAIQLTDDGLRLVVENEERGIMIPHESVPLVTHTMRELEKRSR